MIYLYEVSTTLSQRRLIKRFSELYIYMLRPRPLIQDRSGSGSIKAHKKLANIYLKLYINILLIFYNC